MIGHILPWIQLVSRVEPHNPKNILTAVLIQTCTPSAVALQQNNLGSCKLTIFIDDTFPFNFVSHSVIYLFKLTAKHHLCFHGSDNNKLHICKFVSPTTSLIVNTQVGWWSEYPFVAQSCSHSSLNTATLWMHVQEWAEVLITLSLATFSVCYKLMRKIFF